MALGEITKQLAKQALTDQVADILEPKQAKPPGPENLPMAIIGQMQAMQKACKEDQDLIAFCQAGGESIRIVEVYVPTPQLLVITGFDPRNNLTRVISPATSTEVVCKIVKLQPGATQSKIKFITPKES